MKKNYLLTMLSLVFCFAIQAQTTIAYTQQNSSYNATFTADGTAGTFDNGANELGMYANGSGAKQVVSWKNFTDDGSTAGSATTMKVGDIFKISLAAYQAFGQIGVSLLSSPSTTSSWADRINNYAVQVNLNGNGGSYDPWEIISKDGTVNNSTINGSSSGSGGINEFVFTFTLLSPTKMEIKIERLNNSATSFTETVTINNSNISGFSVYLADDYDGSSNQNIFWKQTTNYVYANVWDGSTDNNWTTAANWSSNSVPSTTANVRIPKTGITNFPTASTAVTINSAYIESGASLIAQSTFAGSMTYERNIPTTNWYLVSAPVEGQTIVDFYTDESPALGSGTGNTQNVAIAPYDNAQTLGADRWNYYTEGQVDGEDGDDTSDTFATGTGYAIKMQASGDVAFTGTLRTNDVGVSLSDGSGTGGNAFNFIGNPYTSYISVSELIEEDNVATGNEALLSEQTIWLWDQSANVGAGAYVQKNLAADLEIAPGQGFFVLTGSAGTFDITEAMQSHSADTFFTPSSNRPEINLTLTNESETRAADIYYIDGTTTGFDNGYDSSIFGGFENEFAMYTHEVTTDSGRNLGIQSLPDNDYENMIIPVGINATSGMTISISASSVNLPTGIKLYLQDTSDNSFTLLENDSKFTTTLTSDLNGSGRFYLYTALDTLGIDSATLNDMIGIYTPTREQLRIVGVQSGAASVVLYNTLGKQVLKTAFQGQGANNIALPTLASGVYVIKLTTESGIINRKIILN